MRKQIIPFVAIVLFLYSCGNSPETQQKIEAAHTAQLKQDSVNLTASLKELDVPSQIFSAPGGELSLIRGKKGTVIFLSPDDLETEDGQAPGNKVIVELKELTTQAELAGANAQTVSGNSLLASGGAYYINMTSGGKQLRLKKDKTLKVSFPRITDSAMMLYYGERNDGGQMNWQPTNVPLSNKEGYSMNSNDTGNDNSIMVYNPRSFKLMGYVGNDSTYKRDTAILHALKKKTKDSIIAARIEAYFQKRFDDSVSWVKRKPYVDAAVKLQRNLYDIASINRLGWVNVDKLASDAEQTNITYTIDPMDSIKVARVYMIYNGINVLTTDNFNNDETDGTRSFRNTPVGYKARLLAVTVRNDELLTCKMDLTIVKDQHTVIRWKKTTKQELQQLFDVNYEWGQ